MKKTEKVKKKKRKGKRKKQTEIFHQEVFEVVATNSYWYRKTLEGLKNFTCYLEPSVCWNIFCQ